MLWRKGRRSDNVIESEGGGGGPRFTGGHKLGLVGVIIIAIIGIKYPQAASLLMSVMDGGGAGAPQQTTTAPAADTPQNDFVKTILGSTEDVWTPYFQSMGKQYVPPKLELFRGGVRTACGTASTAVGPFYCPGDQRVYLDLTFFDQMQSQLHASTADFARAYVIAHEIGHHVQDLLGTFDKEQQLKQQGQPMEGATGLSVRMELQADCFAGVWANRSQKQLQWLQPGDVDAALNAANAIGDDTLQRESRGTVMPDSFTHGTSAQRVHWFKAGFQSGDINQCNTFATTSL